jgi:DinB superfamily
MEREELTRAEAEAWETFERWIDAVPADRRDRPDLEDAWSLKDVLAHIAYWWDDLADSLENGTYADDPEDEDVINARVKARADTLGWDRVRAEADQSRARMLTAWDGLPAVSDIARDSFETATLEHYQDHVEQVAQLGEEAGA